MKTKDFLSTLLLHEISIVSCARYSQYHGYGYLPVTVVSTIIFHNIILLSFFH
jgi:hypothetical protein